ncbi:HEXXH motif-containing putative peptide modification protein [Nonomuraea sp. NBC_01738]|uniref:aKG-HExxH-type peptide beta-hydroxylase n=1 Tax=Nonomuraea sp. NBC_01738 TaxID=2976003 RepID=UPI002E12A085|nr:HEXXH motif-containing putative peptide modification protein [Nonomuraea sp. NBC_01738]
MRTLLAAERSRRLLLLRAVMDLAGAAARPARDLLARAQAADPGAVERCLRWPAVGGWLAMALTRPGHLGRLDAVAAAAAVRAGVPFELTLPTQDGGVTLPSVGRLRADGPEATITGVTGGVAGGRDVWERPRRLRAFAAGLDLGLWIDDLDPYRYPGEAAGRLGDAEVRRWGRALAAAWRLLARDHPHQAAELATLLTTIVPLRAPARGGRVSATVGSSFGAVAMSRPGDPEALAALLVHECQHAKLCALLGLTEVHTDDGGERHFSPWRADPRPLDGLLQGAYAYLGEARFWNTRRALTGAFHAHVAFARRRGELAETLDRLATRRELNPLGRYLVGTMRDRVAAWLREPVPGAAVAEAAELRAAHRGSVLQRRRLEVEVEPADRR